MIGDALSTVWAIGDLHADAHCARAWVRRTGLIDGLHQNVSPEKWDWAEPAAALVFMGDYVDKGPYARSTLNFVRTLNERFGDERVQAILGNHEVNLLVDRATPQGHRYLNYAYAAAHPAQYAEWTVHRQGNVTAVAEETAKMRQALDLLLKALDHLYVTGAYDPQSVLMTPSGRASILHHIPVAQRSLVASELARWQAAYLRGVGPSTPEGAWLSRRPLTVRVAGLVFVHGGVHPTATAAELDEINAAVARSLLPQADLAALGKLLQQRPEIRELVEDRRLHKSCDRVMRALASLNVTRIAVGHTPASSARSACDGGLLALDASLSRWFRASGNFYCPESGAVGQGVDGFCPRISRRCEGQIARFRRNASLGAGWSVDFIEMDSSDGEISVSEASRGTGLREELR